MILIFVKELPFVKVTFVYNEILKTSEVYLNDENVNDAVRTMEVSNAVSIVAAVAEVRQQLVKLQQQMGSQKGIVMDGRAKARIGRQFPKITAANSI